MARGRKPNQKGKNLAAIAKAAGPIVLPLIGELLKPVAAAAGEKIKQKITGSGLRMAGRGKGKRGGMKGKK